MKNNNDKNTVTINQVMDMTNGDEKKFYLIKFIELNIDGVNLNQFSCDELVEVLDGRDMFNFIMDADYDPASIVESYSYRHFA